jgi:leucyl-tRNA synthetase
MAEYNFRTIEQKWQFYWQRNQTFKAEENTLKHPYYMLDMFPYPSGAGLHVGHPLGYIASDIIARYKRHKGFEVLHPMGFDAFGLPAEQYALDTGNHPAEFTDKNIERYKEQLKMIGLSFDWSREVKTSDPKYYKWTQWIFTELFKSWYNKATDKAEGIDSLVATFEKEGNASVKAHSTYKDIFSANDWNSYSENEKQLILLQYRLAYTAESDVNWCEALGTVLANEEVIGGVSERGGFPVEKRKMTQWFLRITAYADKLLQGLETIDWPEPLKEMQRNWIGRSFGAEVLFSLANQPEKKIQIFTTRPDTIFGATFMVLAPEHSLVKEITSLTQQAVVEEYIEQTRRKTERERMSEKKITGVFTGAYAINPFTKTEIPIWIADYVLADYGTGAIMAVPAHDSRDWAFAKHFNLPIQEVVQGGNVQEASYDAKEGALVNSDFLNGLNVKQAIERAIVEIESDGIGKRKVNYRLRDANFSRQRYWGEPFPIIYKNGIPYPVELEDLPVELPEVESYKPTGTGDSPLAAVESWVNTPEGKRETNTMPGWAGSSWYFLRYMDPHNDYEFVSPEKERYWKNVDFYIGGAEHATSHLLYSRFWHRFLFDRGLVTTEEPFKKLINQGMIQGRSSIVYRITNTNRFVSHGLKDNYETTPLHVDVNFVDNDVLDLDKFKAWRPEYANAEFVLEGNKYICGYEIEKMSKRWYNVVTPDHIISKYGCDAFRMYEMFLGPIEQSKPWDTNGIDGVSRFLRKFWALFFNANGEWAVTNEPADREELKILHKAIKRVTEDIERFSLNTCVSTFMIAVNDLTAKKCSKREILEDLVILISPFASHLAEELWEQLGHEGSISKVNYPVANEEYLVESSFEYPIQINGKLRSKIELPLDMSKEDMEKTVLALDLSKWTEGKAVRKVIVVPGKIVNVVI